MLKNLIKIQELLKFYVSKKNFGTCILFLIIFLSTLYHMANPNHWILVSWFSRIMMWFTLFLFMYIRFFIFKKEIMFAEKIALLIILFSAVITPIINHQFSFRSYYDPLMFFFTLCGINSILLVTDFQEEDFKKFLKYFVFLAFIGLVIIHLMNYELLYSILFKNYFSEKEAYIQSSFLISKLFPNPNDFGFYMMLAIVSSTILLYYYFMEKSKLSKKILCFALIVLFLWGGFLSASRASLLCSSIFIIFFIFTIIYINKLYKGAKFKFFVLFIVLTLSIFYFILNYSLFKVFIYKFEHGSSLRFKAWDLFYKDMLTPFPSLKFFFGKGYYSVLNFVFPEKNIHNFLFEMWGKYGFFSMLLLLFFNLYLFFKSFKNKKMFFIPIIIFIFLIHGMFEVKIFFSSMRPQIIFYKIVLLLSLSIVHYKENSRLN